MERVTHLLVVLTFLACTTTHASKLFDAIDDTARIIADNIVNDVKNSRHVMRDPSARNFASSKALDALDAPEKRDAFRDYIQDYAMRSLVEGMEGHSSPADRKRDQSTVLREIALDASRDIISNLEDHLKNHVSNDPARSRVQGDCEEKQEDHISVSCTVDPITCLNGGTCSTESGKCTCADGFFGETCQVPATTKADILVIVDSSSSIGGGGCCRYKNYTKMPDFKAETDKTGDPWRNEKQFVKDLAASVPISKDGVHMALLGFSEAVDEAIQFGQYSNSADFIKHIDDVKYDASQTRIDRALERAKAIFEDSTSGARADARKIVVFITDGKQSKGRSIPEDRRTPSTFAQPLLDQCVRIVAIGVPDKRGRVNCTELESIAGDKKYRHVHAFFTEIITSMFEEEMVTELFGGGKMGTCDAVPVHDPVNGGWGEYAACGDCVGSCGQGTCTKKRKCDNPPRQNGGADCEGSDSMEDVCDTGTICPVNGDWTEWQECGDCSATCGEGTCVQHRTCENPAPQGAGEACTGEPTHTVACYVKKEDCPVDGVWGQYQPCATCSGTCGDATCIQTRACDNPAKRNGGKDCVGNPTHVVRCGSGEPCTGGDMETDQETLWFQKKK